MKIILAGGGTMGSVSPLQAIYETLSVKDPKLQALWLGTKNGPEKAAMVAYGLNYQAIITSKWRQYFSLANIFSPIFFLASLIQSFFIIKKFKPEIILTAGSFVAVPVAYAGWLLKIPVFAHQQDLEIGLANKLIAKVARKISVSLPESLKQFGSDKVVLTGNPVRREILSGNKERAYGFFKLQPGLPIILITGGGTGAQAINQVVLEALGGLVAKYQVIHLCGKGKSISQALADFYDHQTMELVKQRYREYEFLNQEMYDALTVADLVISRAGFSTLSELVVLAKPALLIPLPGHQQLNAQYFAKNNAAAVITRPDFNKEKLLEAVDKIFANPSDLQNLSRNIKTLMNADACEKYVELIFSVLGIK